MSDAEILIFHQDGPAPDIEVYRRGELSDVEAVGVRIITVEARDDLTDNDAFAEWANNLLEQLRDAGPRVRERVFTVIRKADGRDVRYVGQLARLYVDGCPSCESPRVRSDLDHDEACRICGHVEPDDEQL